MPNFNDGEITRLFVSSLGAPGIEDDQPNTPTDGNFYVNIEMVAGGALASQAYTMNWGCNDITAGGPASAGTFLTGVPVPTSGTVSTASGWTNGSSYWTYNFQGTVPLGSGAGKGHIYQYSATLTTANGQVASQAVSDEFLLF
jgi:hypothetical protein